MRQVTGKPLGKDRDGPRRGRRYRVARSVLTSGSSAAASPGGRAPRGCRPRARRQPAPWRAREKACCPSGRSVAYAASPRRTGGQVLLGSRPALVTAGPHRRAEPPSRWNAWGSAAKTRAVKLPETEGRGLRPRPRRLGAELPRRGQSSGSGGAGLEVSGCLVEEA